MWRTGEKRSFWKVTLLPVKFKQLLLRADASTPVTVYLKDKVGREYKIVLNPNLSSMQTFYISFDPSSKKITVSKIQNKIKSHSKKSNLIPPGCK